MVVNLFLRVFASKEGANTKGTKPMFERHLYSFDVQNLDLPAMARTFSTLFKGTNPVIQIEMEV